MTKMLLAPNIMHQAIFARGGWVTNRYLETVIISSRKTVIYTCKMDQCIIYIP